MLGGLKNCVKLDSTGIDEETHSLQLKNTWGGGELGEGSKLISYLLSLDSLACTEAGYVRWRKTICTRLMCYC